MNKKMIFISGVFFLFVFISGCGSPTGNVTEQAPKQIPEKPTELAYEEGLGVTIGSVAEVFSIDTIDVEGYAIVGGLAGTGSAECPEYCRVELEKYILRKLPKINVRQFISSYNTAAVRVDGTMPTAASGKRGFDLLLSALVGTQTTSLEGGWLYGVDLKAKQKFGSTMRILADGQGPVFIDTIGPNKANKKVGYVLGGGKSLREYNINLTLRKPDFKTVNLIRNILNQRFGYIARAISASVIELRVPSKYTGQKQRFISVINSMYLVSNAQLTKERILSLVRNLAVSPNKDQSEYALEAIGNESVEKLSILLNSSNEEVRLRAGRCMLNLGNDVGLNSLRQIALDKRSNYRLEALDAITLGAKRNDSTSLSRLLLRDDDFDVRLAAYENLLIFDDISVTQSNVGRIFYLDEISQTPHKSIYVSRSGSARIVLFGSPLYCEKNIFVQSADRSITINAPSGQSYVSVTRKVSNIPPITLKSSFEVGDIIRTLCEEPKKREESGRIGLGVSYPEAIALLKQMCEKGIVHAEFRAGALPKIGLKVKE